MMRPTQRLGVKIYETVQTNAQIFWKAAVLQCRCPYNIWDRDRISPDLYGCWHSSGPLGHRVSCHSVIGSFAGNEFIMNNMYLPQ